MFVHSLRLLSLKTSLASTRIFTNILGQWQVSILSAAIRMSLRNIDRSTSVRNSRKYQQAYGLVNTLSSDNGKQPHSASVWGYAMLHLRYGSFGGFGANYRQSISMGSKALLQRSVRELAFVAQQPRRTHLGRSTISPRLTIRISNLTCTSAQQGQEDRTFVSVISAFGLRHAYQLR
jgi:hypothetical protein